MSNPAGRTPRDLTGQRFGRLVVISLNHHIYGQYFWNLKCDCGNVHISSSAMLRQGDVKSCGCSKKNNPLNIKHGHTVGRKETKTHKSWSGMMARCYTPSTSRYEDWGGRGIKVCDRWHDFSNFLSDMGECPEGMSIDRYPNNDGNYEPGNCRWATAKQQGENKRPYRSKHNCTCQICGSSFLAIMPWASTCSKDCRMEYSRRRMREKRSKDNA